MEATTSSVASTGVRCGAVAEHRGEYWLTIDPTGRIAWPDAVTDAFGPVLVFSRWLHGCLIAAPEDVWQRISSGAAPDVPAVEDLFFRRLTAGAQKVTVDTAGRCTVPRHLRDWAGIAEKGPVTVSAQGGWVEIWSQPRFTAYLEQTMRGLEPQLAAATRLGPGPADREGAK